MNEPQPSPIDRLEAEIHALRAALPGAQRPLMVSLDRLGVENLSVGAHAPAIEALREALTLAAAVGTPQDLLRIKRRLANCYQEIGHFSRAIDLYDQCRPPDDAPVVDRFGWTDARARMAERVGDADRTTELYDRAVILFDALPRPYGRAIFALSNAAMWFAARDIPRAERLLRKFRRAVRDEQQEVPALEVSVIRATIAETRGLFATADRHWRGAAEAIGQGGQEMLRDSVAVSRASTLARLGRTAEATSLLRARMMDGQPAKLTSPQIAVATTLGCLLLDQMDDDAATTSLDEIESCLRQALAAEAMRGMPDAEWRIFAGLADLAARLDQADSSILFGKASVRSVATLSERDQVVGDPDQPRLLPYQRLIDRLVIAGRFPEAVRVQSMMMQEKVFELVSLRLDADRRDSTMPLRPSEESILAEQQLRCERLRALRFESEALDREEGELARIETAQRSELKGLSNWLDRVLGGTWTGRGTPEATPAAAVPMAMRGAGILQFLKSDGGWTAVLQTACGTSDFRVAGNVAEISLAIYDFRQRIMARAADWKRPANELFRRLLGPVESSLNGLETLEIVPDGPLSFLPFAALHDGERSLFERFELMFRTGLAATPLDAPPAMRRILLMGAPGSPRHMLHHVDAELAAIARHWPEARISRPFTGERLVEELAAGAEIVHLASHFTFDPTTPDRSYFELHDGERLTLGALRSDRFRLSGVQLLTLSACETAITDHGAFGPESLAGIAQSKGVRNVLGTLWPVADASTATFMDSFYGELAQDFPSPQAAGRALRNTQLALMSGRVRGRSDGPQRGGLGGSDDDWRLPYHWAGYALFGLA